MLNAAKAGRAAVAAATAAQRGFSLVEVIAAMVILTVGVLGLAASAAAVARLTTEGARMSGAANAASSKIEELRSLGATPELRCAALTSSSDTWPGGYSRTWRVVQSGDKATVTLVISYSNGRQTRSTTYISEISCV